MHRLLSRWVLIGVLLLPGSALCDQDQPPPLFPPTEKFLSLDIQRWMLPLVESWIPNEGVERIIRYIEEMPGDVKVKLFHTQGHPKPTPREIHDFYRQWADEAGYRLVVEVRHGDPPPPYWPEENYRPYQSPERWIDYDPDEYYWVDAYHRPSPEGGVFVWVWQNHELFWFWVEGYIPIGPVLGEFLGVPRGPVDAEPPTEVAPMEEPSFELPSRDFFVRVRLGSYEIERVAADLGLRAEEAGDEAEALEVKEGVMEALLSVAPDLLEPVRAAVSYTYEGSRAEREASLTAWHLWRAERNWPKLGEGTWGRAEVAVWAASGPRGGAMIIFHIADTSTVVVLDGGPNLLALLPVLTKISEGADAEGAILR